MLVLQHLLVAPALVMALHFTVIAIYSLTILLHFGVHTIWSMTRFGLQGFDVGWYAIHGIALAPAAAYFLGLRWCRYIVGCVAGVLIPMLLILPMVLHEVERTVPFYVIWSLALIVFVGTAVISFFSEGQRKMCSGR